MCDYVHVKKRAGMRGVCVSVE